MISRKQKTYILAKIKKLVIFVVFLLALLLCEASLRYKISYAVTSFDDPKLAIEQPGNNQPSEIEIATSANNHPKSRAPEPSSLMLLFGGIGTMVLRFARISFHKFKRMLDLFLCAAAITISAPILLLAVIMIKISSKGPVIYKQNRVGKKGKIFQIYKLRTMCVDAEKGTGAVWAKKNDCRITKIGKLLRKSHIDEIPQLINVIRGEMSIVGPRPERPEMVRDLKKLICDYEKRLHIEPGITGLSQIYNKYDETILDVKRKVKYDLLYIKKMCLWVEMKILARTVVVAMTGSGAK